MEGEIALVEWERRGEGGGVGEGRKERRRSISGGEGFDDFPFPSVVHFHGL